MVDRPVAHPEREDPQRPKRLVIGLIASGLMVLSVFFTATVIGLPDGSHTGLLRSDYGVREALYAVVGLGAAWFVLNPFRPDPRVAQAAMLAAGIVGVAVGFTLFAGAIQVQTGGDIVTSYPGPQAWMLLVSGVLFVTLRFRRSLWPESPWMADLMQRTPKRPVSRRR